MVHCLHEFFFGKISLAGIFLGGIVTPPPLPGFLMVRPLTSALSEIVVFDLRSEANLVFLQSFVRSTQLSACHLLRFVYEISAQFCHNFTIEPLCSPRNKSAVCNNTLSKHGASTVKSRQIQCRLSTLLYLALRFLVT